MKYVFTVLILLLFLCTGNIFAQWDYWLADEFPIATADTAWHLGPEERTEVTLSTIIDDPDITENKLLKITSTVGADEETFKYNWDAGVETGATLVIRMKAIGDGTHSRDWDIYIQNGVYRERMIANSGNRIKFDKSGMEISDFGVDLNEWHVYRLTLIQGVVDLYIDEDPLAWLSTQNAPDDANGGNYFRFGDNGGDTYGTYYDWIAWDVSGAYPPEEGDPLPTILTGPLSVEKVSPVIPEKFTLFQNFPNPFNPVTEIRFNLNKKSDVIINIYDIRGRLIRTLVSDTKPAGEYTLQWDGRDMAGITVPSGNYFYTIKAGNSLESKKMTLLK